MKIAIFGGTFNPPHLGHMFLANEVRTKLGYEKILFIPSNIPAHKETSVESKHRLEMVKIITAPYSWADYSSCDIDRGGVTRTIDTIRDIKKIYNLSEKPGFIIGDDLVPGFKKWKDPVKISNESTLIVAVRGAIDISDFEFKHLKVTNRVFPLSSSELRNRVRKKEDIDFLVPPSVIEYIEINELYRQDIRNR